MPIALPTGRCERYLAINCQVCGRFTSREGLRIGGHYDGRGEWVDLDVWCARCARPPPRGPASPSEV